MGNYSFAKDLLHSDTTVNEIADILAERNIDILDFNDDWRYDILAAAGINTIKLEVKEDFQAYKTGNVAVEYEYRGKPSGVNHTEANFFIYKIHEKGCICYYIIRTETLKKLIEKKLYSRLVIGGDAGSCTRLYLFNLLDWQKYSSKFHEVRL